MSPNSVILYRYDASPFSHKVDHVLLVKHIPHQTVNVSPLLPRPEITDILGINYRRIPVLAIGNDVYCDTSLIVSALERRFPSSAGYGTIFPLSKHGGGADTGIIKAFAKFYADSTLFSPAPNLLPWDKIPTAFVKDRSALAGAPINVSAIIANRDKSLSQLSSHLYLLEEQLRDGREWLFDTELPGLADISVHFIFEWVKGFRSSIGLFDENAFSHSIKWLARTTSFLERQRNTQASSTELKGDVAGEIILTSPHEPYSVVGFDVTEAARLGVRQGRFVKIAPDDTGRNYPTTGKLVALNKEEIVVEVEAPKGHLHCHFPRLTYSVKSFSKNKL